jgi:hypothetical protein
MPGASLNSATDRKASPERSALKPYRGKPAVRNFRGGYGNGGIIRSPLSAMTLLDREPGDLQHAFESMRRPVREGHKPNGGRARAGEVGLCRSTCEPTEQGKATSCGGRGGKGAAGGEHRSTAHAPDSEQESACPRVWTVRVKQASVAGLLSRHSSFRRAVCVDAHVRICAGGAQRWASLPRQ